MKYQPSRGPHAAVIETARRAYTRGLCPLPIKGDGSKAPNLPRWRECQQQCLSPQALGVAFHDAATAGLALVCGVVSSGLEALDFDDVHTYHSFKALAGDAGLADVVRRVERGYVERTPNDGRHWLYYTEATSTAPLARRPKRDDELTEDERTRGGATKTLIETRGQGAYIIIAPTNGRCHPTGRPYALLQGGLDTIARITPSEREELHRLARSFDEMPPPDVRPPGPIVLDGNRPGDAFNREGDALALLVAAGWQVVHQRGETVHLRRPGKRIGTSGTYNYGGSRLFFCFTSSTAFTASSAYDPFGVYSVLHHGGDFTAAAKALAEQGYGETRVAQPAADTPALPDPSPESTLPRVPAFPTAVLPKAPRTFVVAAAAAIGCPPDFIALPLLALLEGVVGNTRRLLIRAGYELLPGAWFLVIGEPGTGKTPGFKYALLLVRPLTDAAWERHREALRQWEQTPSDERGARPELELYIATDNTTEGLNKALATSPGVTQVEDEARRLWRSFDAYRAGGDRQYRLSLWSNATITVLRASKPPLYITDPVCPLIGGLQPGVLPSLRGESDALGDDGWLPRFLSAWPDAEPPPLSDTPFDAKTAEPVVALFGKLRSKVPRDHKLSDAAWAVFKTWHERNRQHQLACRGIERQWAAKAPDHLGRLILDLHLLAGPDTWLSDVSAATVRDAITLLEYFRSHLGRVLPALGAPVIGTIEGRILRLLDILGPENGESWASRSDLYHRLGNVKVDAFNAALTALLDAEKIECRTEPGPTKRARSYRVRNSHYSQFLPQDTPDGDSANDIANPPFAMSPPAASKDGDIANNANCEPGVDLAIGELTGDIPPRVETAGRALPRFADRLPATCWYPLGCQWTGPCPDFQRVGHCKTDDEPP